MVSALERLRTTVLEHFHFYPFHSKCTDSFSLSHSLVLHMVQSPIMCLSFTVKIQAEVGWEGRVGKVSFDSEPLCSLFLERHGSEVLVVDHRAIIIDLSQCQRASQGSSEEHCVEGKRAVMGGRKCLSNLNFVLRHLWPRCGDRMNTEQLS